MAQTTEQILKGYDSPNFNFIYGSLVHKVLEHERLNKWIEKRTSDEPKILNLITDKWHTAIQNSPIFQEYLSNNVRFFKYDATNKAVTNYRVQEYNKYMNILVIGIFKLVLEEKTGKLVLKLIDCIPLQCIAEVMCHSLEKNIMHNAKFFINGCNGSCPKCREYKASNGDWCVKKSFVFSKELKYADRYYCESRFKNQETQMILELELSNVYTFGDRCKVGGKIKHMIFVEDIFNSGDDYVEGILKRDESFMPVEENGGTKRGNDDEETEDSKKFKRGGDEENQLNIEDFAEEGDIVALPKGMDCVKPREKKVTVESKIKDMP